MNLPLVTAKTKGLIVLAIIIIFVGWAYSARADAGVLTFTTSTTTGSGSVIPVLTWSTAPVAASCTASGAWTGAKAPAGGTETLAAITSSKTYALLCTWADGSATVSWVPPTQRTDGTPLTDLTKYRVYYGLSSTAMTTTSDVLAPATSKVFTPLATGTWFFNVHAIDSVGGESGPSNTGSKAVTQGSSTQQIAITVNPVPMAPTGVTVN